MYVKAIDIVKSKNSSLKDIDKIFQVLENLRNCKAA